jgi:hypothetical protein
MTKSERTQLGYLAFAAISGRRRHRSAWFPRLLIGFVVFTLACFAAGAALELIHWVVAR